MSFNEDQPIRSSAKFIAKGWVIALMVIIAVGLLSGLIYAFTSVTSDARGKVDAQNKINSGTNRIEQYDHFFTLDGDIRTQAQNAALAKSQLDDFNKTTPPSSQESPQISEQRANLQSTYTGLVQLCTANVNQYNNDAASYTKAKFLDSALPWDYSTTVCTDPSKLPPAPKG